jgi:broad specificity phosphatase PhoE
VIVYLVRHGRSNANDAGLVTGTPDDTLCGEGVEQSMRTAAWLNELGISADRYVTSQWRRAQQTAIKIRPGITWDVDVRVGETKAGDAAEWPLDYFLAKFPDFYSNNSNQYPNGESHADLNERVLQWFHEQLSDPVSSLMLVAHSGPISCILQYVIGLGMERFPSFLPAHSSLSVIDVSRDTGSLRSKLLGFSLGPSTNILDYAGYSKGVKR